MFRIECFCDDKMLAKLLWALSEFGAYNVTNVPVRDNTGANGAAAPKKSRGRLIEQVPAAFAAFVKKRKLRVVKAAHIKEFVTALGYSPSSHAYISNSLRLFKLIEKIPGAKHLKDTQYRVVVSQKKLASLKKARPPGTNTAGAGIKTGAL